MIRVTNVVKYHGAAPHPRRRDARDPQGAGRGARRPVRRREEHAAALHQRAGAVPGRRGRGRRVGQARRRRSTAEGRRCSQLRRTVGMVFQQFNLFPHMTALKNVMSGPGLRPGQAARRGRGDREEAARPRRAGREVRRAAGATSPAGSNSVLRSPGRLRLTPRRSSSTSRPAPSTRRWPREVHARDRRPGRRRAVAGRDGDRHARPRPRSSGSPTPFTCWRRGGWSYSGPAAEAFAPGGAAAALE